VRSTHHDGVSYRINADGFRDGPYARRKPPGTFRIVVLGDSVAFGFGVQAEETFPKQLEQLLRVRLAPADVEVLNLGVNGYNPYTEAMLFVDVGVDYEADLVLVQFCPNDLGDPTLFESTAQIAIDFPVEAFPDPGRKRRPTLPERACRGLRTCMLIGHVLAGWEDGPTVDDVRAAGMPVVGDRELAWLRRRYAEIATAARAHGAAFALLVVPMPPAVEGRPAPLHERIVTLARDAGWTTVDPLPALQEATARDHVAVFLPRDPWHLTPGGHRIVAAAIVTELARSHLLPEAGSRS
jgi:lysophospholipase L1-like esterase